jgi:hypothetical protein
MKKMNYHIVILHLLIKMKKMMMINLILKKISMFQRKIINFQINYHLKISKMKVNFNRKIRKK